MRILLFSYWNDLVLDLVETYFLEVGAYVSLKRATASVWEGRFADLEWKYHSFSNIKTGEWEMKVFLFNSWNDSVLGSVETDSHNFVS